VKYLGHVVGRDGVATDPDKVRAIEDWVTPRNLRCLRAFLGLVGYYRQYIPDFALEYILDTDASDHNVGAVLSQVQGGQEVVVAYYSISLTH